MEKKPLIFFSVVSALLIGFAFVDSATISQMAGSDTLSASRSVINNNLNAVNQELTYNDEAVIWTLNSATAFRIYNSNGSTTVLTVNTASGSTTVAGMMYSSNFYATSTTATSSFLGGVIAGQGIRLTGFGSCNLDTDSNGFLQCGSDSTGSAVPDVTYGLISATRYYQASTTATDNLSWRFANGFVSQASSTISSLNLGVDLTVANGGTGVSTLTDNGVLIGAGTGAIEALTVGTNGQLLVGSTAAAPVFATANCAAGLTCTLGAGTFQIDLDVVSIALGGTNSTTYPLNSLLFYNGTSILATSTQPLFIGSLNATSSALTSTFSGPVYITASSTHSGFLYRSGNATTSGNVEVFNGQFVNRMASSSGDTVHIVEWASSTMRRILLGANSTIILNATSSQPIDGGLYKLLICQDNAGARTVTWGYSDRLRWWRGTTTVDSTANECTLVGFLYDGLTRLYYGVASSTDLNSR